MEEFLVRNRNGRFITATATSDSEASPAKWWPAHLRSLGIILSLSLTTPLRMPSTVLLEPDVERCSEYPVSWTPIVADGFAAADGAAAVESSIEKEIVQILTQFACP